VPRDGTTRRRAAATTPTRRTAPAGGAVAAGAHDARVVRDGDTRGGPPDECGPVAARPAKRGTDVGVVRDGRRERALRSRFDTPEPVEHAFQPVSAQLLRPSVIEGLVVVVVVQLTLQPRDPVFEPVGPLLGGLTVPDGLGSPLRLGVETLLQPVALRL
jgi:hypothetical protein